MADIDDANQTPKIMATIAILGLIGPLAVTLRFIARRRARVSLWWDDWFALIAVIVVVAIACSAFYGGSIGVGRHMEWVIMKDSRNPGFFLQWIFSMLLLYPFAIGPIKCSVLMLYIRVFRVRPLFVKWCYFVIGLTVAWMIATFFTAVFQCHPVSDAWNPLADRAGCIDLRLYFIGTNVPNIVMDFIILLTPLVPIWQLKLPTRKKIYVSLMLLLGAGEVAFSTVRLVMLLTISTDDPTWNYTPATIWSFVEMAVGVTCACLPCLGPLLPKKNARQQTSGLTHRSEFTDSTKHFSRLDDNESQSGRAPGPYSIPSELVAINKTTEISVTRSGSTGQFSEMEHDPNNSTLVAQAF